VLQGSAPTHLIYVAIGGVAMVYGNMYIYVGKQCKQNVASFATDAGNTCYALVSQGPSFSYIINIEL
jgi:hypothetical protein